MSKRRESRSSRSTFPSKHGHLPLLLILLAALLVVVGDCAPSFQQYCSVANIDSMATAATLCPADKPYLAVPRSSSEVGSIASQVTPGVPAVIGGYESSTNIWRWHTSTAYPDRMFFFYSIDGTTRTLSSWPVPQTWNPGSGTGMLLSSSGTFSSINFGSSSTKCVICEQRTCNDFCVSTGTQALIGTNVYPSCTCGCRPGYSGADCSYTQTLSCQASKYLFTDALLKCRSLKAYIATPMSMTSFDGIYEQMPNGLEVLFGGSDAATENTWLWLDGPATGTQFWSGGIGGSPVSPYSIQFKSTEPNGGVNENYLSVKPSSMKFNDCNPVTQSITCVACQLTTTCFDLCDQGNSFSATGTIADTCKCNCKPGYIGQFCRCPDNSCNLQGGASVETSSGCGCVCRATYRGPVCNMHTDTVSLTLSHSHPITDTHKKTQTSALSSSISRQPTSTHTNLVTPSTSQTRTRPPTHTPTRTATWVQTASTSLAPTATWTSSVSLTLPTTGSSELTTTASIVQSSTDTLTMSRSLPLTSSNPITITESGLGTQSVSPSQSSSKEVSRSCGDATWRSPCDAMTWELSTSGNETYAVNATSQAPNTSVGCIPSLFVPYAVWGQGDVHALVRFPHNKLLPRAFSFTNESTGAAPAPAPRVVIGSLPSFALSGGSALGVVLQRRDEATLGKSFYTITLPRWLFACGIPFDLAAEIIFEARPRSQTAQDVQDVGTGLGSATSVLTGSPGGAVRGGVMSTVSGLMRCSSTDVTADISGLNNPLELHFGDVEGAYLRGSILSGAVVVCVGFGLCGFVLLGAYAWSAWVGEEHPGLRELVAMGRLPSSVVSIVAIGMEMATGSAMTLLSMDSDYGNISDRVVGAVFIVLAAVYCGHVCASCFNAPVQAVEVRAAIPNDASLLRRASKYLFEPTHELELTVDCQPSTGHATLSSLAIAGPTDPSVSSRQRIKDREWVRRNAFYTADLKWPLFRGIELYVGLAANLIEGFAATGNVSCMVRIVLMIISLWGTVVLLVVTRACAIRAMLWSTILLNVLMGVAAVLALVNVLAVSADVEDAADWILTISSLIIVVQSAIDIILTAASIVPATRSCFRFLRKRIGEDREGDGCDDEEMIAPLARPFVNDLEEPPLFPPRKPKYPPVSNPHDSFVDRVSKRLALAPLEHGRRDDEEEADIHRAVYHGYSTYLTPPPSASDEEMNDDEDDVLMYSDGDEQEEEASFIAQTSALQLGSTPPSTSALPPDARGEDDDGSGESDTIPPTFVRFLSDNGIRLDSDDDQY